MSVDEIARQINEAKTDRLLRFTPIVILCSIRHSVAKWLRKSGVDAWHTSSQLGHKKRGSEITEVYASSDPSYLEFSLDAIEEFFH